ncbi:uncharacterized protein OGAPODRAFT_77314 [Ogataea polymorpha]|uniref:uncharacterized protein n=1 Tax=Ogataea polymorpha TaxID=460523 RepID=UPI0007F480B6|nr:uncharacterized protein OGAPODRAFT_77314 [Ogataea polymorpha]KAG7939081.1 hypothetical protein KL934_000015 [Ogataea polymorpha]OBA15126.1 hypothetical protein OGAPODRAFT_77314 [Ogataea polymorpha]
MDSKLAAFQTSDTKKLYGLTDRFFKDGVFNCYLTSQQFNLLDLILHRFKDAKARIKLWDAFINNNLFLEFEQGPSLADKEVEEMSSTGAEEIYLKQGTKSTRNLCATIRYLLYEKAVDYYFGDEKMQDTRFAAFDILEESDDEDNFEDAEEKPLFSQTSSNNATRNEEDDYDDDDEDDEKQQEPKDSRNGSESDVVEVNDSTDKDATLKVSRYREVPEEGELEENEQGQLKFVVNVQLLLARPEFPSIADSISSADEAIGSMVHPILGTASAIESNFERQNELKLIKNFNKVYHSFENDLPNIVKRRKLERSDKALELNDTKDHGSSDNENGGNDNEDSQHVNKLMGLGGAANLSLKNLLARIEENRDKLNLTDLELKNLIMDVRKNRSKWASYNRIGQEELYEACEKVVLELRGYTEHSIAFLNRVSKREAPNYYQIIKKPMDLNTVMKKLKNFQYNSKAEFVDDLMLIWKNCLTYNSDPNHFLRADAIAMQKKTLSLIPLIPDIVIRDRAEVEKEAAAAAQQNEAEDAQEKPGFISSRGVGGSSTSAKKAKKSRKGLQEADHTEPPTASDSPIGDSTGKKDANTSAADQTAEQNENEFSQPQGASNPSIEPSNASTPPVSAASEEKTGDREGTANPEEDDNEDDATAMMEDRQAQEQQNDRNEDDDNEDLEMSTWRTLTSNTRYKLCQQRSNLFKGGKIQPNEEALLRDPLQISNFSNYLDDSSKVVLHRNRQCFDENDDPYLIEYDICGGIPSLKYKGPDYDAIENDIFSDMMKQGKSLDQLPESPFSIKMKGSNSVIYKNIALMQDIRKVCFKINIVRQMQTSQFIHQSQYHAPDIERIKPEDIDPLSKLPTRDQLVPQVAYAALERSVSTILMANGFETTNPTCVTTVTQLAEQYFGNLVKSLKMNMESNSINKLPLKSKRPMSLKDILLISLQENGIEKPDVLYSHYKEHLTKQNKKLTDLKYKLEGFLRDLLRPGIQEITENQFTDDSEQFLNGDFSNEIGEDFFGFKELGLDKEFNLLTSTIPLHLLHSKLSNQLSHLDSKSKKAKYEDFQEVQFPKLRKRDLASQIGLLRPFYEDLLSKSRAAYAKQLKKHRQSLGFTDPEGLPAASNGTPKAPESGSAPNGGESSSTFVEIEDPEDLVILEDDDLPLKQRNHRPKVPPNGRITQVKRKLINNAFFLEAQDLREQQPQITIADPQTSTTENAETKVGNPEIAKTTEEIPDVQPAA